MNQYAPASIEWASMRPRFANRGSPESRAEDARNERGFNEAPIRESGKSKRQRLDCLHHNRFNEAPIRESGKLLLLCRGRGVGSGFNEAPIRESGKSPAPRADGCRASCFNEAPIRESGKFRSCPECDRSNKASMRPRFANRGSAPAVDGRVMCSPWLQ